MKIICIGWNYDDHNREMSRNGRPEAPIFFLKPDTALLRDNKPFFLPDFSERVEYECELVYRIDRIGKNIAERFAHRYYSQVALGIDFTARDLQAVGGQHIGFSLYKNGSQVQSASTDDMIFTIDKIIAYVSRYMTLKIGDLIYTGTPSGVGMVAIGDNLRGLIGDKEMFDFFVR